MVGRWPLLTDNPLAPPQKPRDLTVRPRVVSTVSIISVSEPWAVLLDLGFPHFDRHNVLMDMSSSANVNNNLATSF